MRIGISAYLAPPDEGRPVFPHKTLLCVERSMAELVVRAGGQPCLVLPGSDLAGLDGVLLQGGEDLAPNADADRDRYERDLVHACLERDVPLFGICRGIQIINVALGGTLIRDIPTEIEGARDHIDRTIYAKLHHGVTFEPGARLTEVFGASEGRVNSTHHQAVRALGRNLVVEARSVPEGIIEAVRLARPDRFVFAVQWHPEWQRPEETELLDPVRLLGDFFAAMRSRR